VQSASFIPILPTLDCPSALMSSFRSINRQYCIGLRQILIGDFDSVDSILSPQAAPAPRFRVGAIKSVGQKND
jgi:hypothetical protein